MEGTESGERRIRQYDIQIEIRLTRSKTDISGGVILEDARRSPWREDAERLPALGAFPSVSARREPGGS
jgi:hypothetical protein